MSLSKEILKTNFSSLQILLYVHEFQSFSVAADKLGVTQSTVSYTISKLRSIFADKLFVREGNIVVPTQRCDVIAGHVTNLLTEFEGMTAEPEFVPALAQGTIAISCNYYERMTVLPDFIQKIRSRAPRLRLKFMTASALGEEQLKRGECDLLIGPVQLTGDQIFKRRFRQDSYVYLMDAENALVQRTIGFQELKTAKHLVIKFSGDWQPLYINALKSHGVLVNPAIEMSDYGDVSAYLKGSDLIACLPKRLADRMDIGLARVETPISIPLEIDIFWTARTHESKLHAWVRQTLAECE